MTIFGLFIMLHIVFGSICLLVGLVAALSKKRRGWHTFLGELYHGSYVLVFISAIVTSIIHWEESAYLFYIALFSYGLALFGYIARKRRSQNWLPKHIAGMIGSYIGIITAVLVVNIANLPFVNELPSFIFWFLPTIIGTPIIIMISNRVKYKRV